MNPSKHADQYQLNKRNLYKSGVNRKIEKHFLNVQCDCKNYTKGCDKTCLNRLCKIECGRNCRMGFFCGNKCFQKGLSAVCEVFHTKKKGFGLRLKHKIPSNDFIIELKGEVEEYSKFMKAKKDTSYAVKLRVDAILDSAKKGNMARFINHSCSPNAQLEKWIVNGEIRLGVFSLKPINVGEEITIDYKWENIKDSKMQPCYCESPQCRGLIGF